MYGLRPTPIGGEGLLAALQQAAGIGQSGYSRQLQITPELLQSGLISMADRHGRAGEIFANMGHERAMAEREALGRLTETVMRLAAARQQQREELDARSAENSADNQTRMSIAEMGDENAIEVANIQAGGRANKDANDLPALLNNAATEYIAGKPDALTHYATMLGIPAQQLLRGVSGLSMGEQTDVSDAYALYLGSLNDLRKLWVAGDLSDEEYEKQAVKLAARALPGMQGDDLTKSLRVGASSGLPDNLDEIGRRAAAYAAPAAAAPTQARPWFAPGTASGLVAGLAGNSGIGLRALGTLFGGLSKGQPAPAPVASPLSESLAGMLTPDQIRLMREAGVPEEAIRRANGVGVLAP